MSQFSQNILQRVSHFIEQQRLLTPLSNPVFVGLSGGPDSVALLHILHALGYECVALHCNFHLRGEESQRDEQFCRQLCQNIGVTIQVKDFNTRAYMKEHHLSLEMAARQLRYDWWETLVNGERQNGKIALGHHQDDSIETLLMNLMRGTGIQGLTGIVANNERSHVVRPLLCLSRQDILDYLRDKELSYVIDSTNADNDTLRNQIRNQLLPLMEQMVPQARNGIAQTIEHLKGTAAFADDLLKEYDFLTEHHNRWGIEWDELSLDSLSRHFGGQAAEDFLFEWKRRYCNASTQRVVRIAHLIYTQPLDDTLIEQHRPTLSIDQNEASAIDPQSVKASDLCQHFDASRLELPLMLRRWQEGNRITPLGMNGHTKLVSDLFTNAHYTPMQKATTWLVTDASGAIIWVAGLRISERHKVTETTTQVISVKLN